MTETPEPTPEQTDDEPEAGQTTVTTTEGEPMYGPKDVQRALETSGQRALVQSYFDKMGAATTGIPKSEADAMVDAIKNGQPYPPPPHPEQQTTQAQTTDQPESEQQPAPPEGGAA